MAKLAIKDISFKDYLVLNLEDLTLYSYYLEYGNIEAEDTLSIGSFFDRSFGFVKDMQYYCSEGLTWEIFFNEVSKITDYDKKKLGEMSIFKLQKARLYCIDEVKKINKIEVDFLGHASSPEQEQADISRFGPYGAFIQFDKLAEGNILKIEEIKKLKYEVCFTKLKLEADRADFMNDYNQIMSQKK